MKTLNGSVQSDAYLLQNYQLVDVNLGSKF